MAAGNDWFAGFMKRTGDIALRKPEALHTYIHVYSKCVEWIGTPLTVLPSIKICVRNWIPSKNRNSFSIWTRHGFRLIIFPLKFVASKGESEVRFMSVGRTKTLTTVACYIESGTLFSRLWNKILGNITAEFASRIWSYNNRFRLLQWRHLCRMLQHFQKHRSPGKCLYLSWMDMLFTPSKHVWTSAEKMALEYDTCFLIWLTELCSNPSRRTVITRKETVCNTILKL